jgi:Na+-translocating ferredoxin:NAD+ oxidoreductase RnfG subunit
VRARLIAPPLLAAVLTAVAGPAARAHAQEGQFLTDVEAPKAVFPQADRVERHDVTSTPALRDRMLAKLAGTTPSLWEATYPLFHVWHGSEVLGSAVVVEEVGKHRPITFVVGVRPDGTIADVAVMAYREAYGGEVATPRFLRQYRDRGPADALKPYGDITNIAGATLSVEAASRAVKKAQALVAALDAGDAP